MRYSVLLVPPFDDIDDDDADDADDYNCIYITYMGTVKLNLYRKRSGKGAYHHRHLM